MTTELDHIKKKLIQEQMVTEGLVEFLYFGEQMRSFYISRKTTYYIPVSGESMKAWTLILSKYIMAHIKDIRKRVADAQVKKGYLHFGMRSQSLRLSLTTTFYITFLGCVGVV